MQMNYLARLYQQTKDDRYREAFQKGVNYILSGQYENGGWPQFWPTQRDYQVQITYNDDAMVNILTMMRDILKGKEQYAGLSDEKLNEKIEKSFRKGIDCILNTQIKVGDTLTVWCQQHDRKTLYPTYARAYELPSFCSQESAAIVRFLMTLPNPDERVRRAINSAMAWFEKTKITGYRLEKIGKKGEPGADTRLVADPNAEPLWARFYDLLNCQPFVCDRDGMPRKHLSDIGPERRNGYSWYNTRPATLYKNYEKWKNKYEK
jgi:PelA/Pel-15E family pectate lyase